MSKNPVQHGRPLPLLTFSLSLALALVSFAAQGAPIDLSAAHQLCVDTLQDKAPKEGQESEVSRGINAVSVDSQTRVDLLNQVLDRRNVFLNTQIALANSLQSCIDLKSNLVATAPSCSHAILFLNRLNEKIAMARVLLGASQSQFEDRSARGQSDTKPNESLASLGSFKMKSWRPLSQLEHAQVTEALEAIRSKKAEELRAKDGVVRDPALQLGLAKERYGFFIDYLSLISGTPLIQWATGSAMSPRELHEALQAVIKLARKDLSTVQEQANAVYFYRGLLETRPIVYSPLQYTSETEAVARSSETVCWSLLKMKREHLKAQQEDRLAVSLATIPFFFFPGTAGLIGTSLISGGFIVGLQQDLLNTESRELSQTFIDWNAVANRNNALQESRKDRNEQSFLIVVGFPILRGGKLAIRATRQTLKEFQENRKLLLDLARLTN